MVHSRAWAVKGAPIGDYKAYVITASEHSSRSSAELDIRYQFPLAQYETLDPNPLVLPTPCATINSTTYTCTPASPALCCPWWTNPSGSHCPRNAVHHWPELMSIGICSCHLGFSEATSSYDNILAEFKRQHDDQQVNGHHSNRYTVSMAQSYGIAGAPVLYRTGNSCTQMP